MMNLHRRDGSASPAASRAARHLPARASLPASGQDVKKSGLTGLAHTLWCAFSGVTASQAPGSAPEEFSTPSWFRLLYVAATTLLLIVWIGRWSVVTLDALHSQGAHSADLTGHKSDQSDSAELSLAASVRDTTRPVVDHSLQLLVLGDSQTFNIVDLQPGDLNSSQWLQVLLSRQRDPWQRRAQVRLGSLPGIDVVEALIETLAAAESVPRRGDVVILAVDPQELRHLGSREEVRSLARTAPVQARLRNLVQQARDLPQAVAALAPCLESGSDRTNQAVASAVSPDDSSLATRLEARLQRFAERWPFFAHREAAAIWLGFASTAWRNGLLGLTSARRRPLIGPQYQASLQVLEILARYARSEHLHLVLYLAPIRPAVPGPFSESDLEALRHDLKTLCERYRLNCFDYMRLIPADEFGNVASDLVTVSRKVRGQPDFVHFAGSAHKALAERLFVDLHSQLEDWGRQKEFITE